MVKKNVILITVLFLILVFFISNKRTSADSCPGDYCSNSGICGYPCSDPYWSTSLNRCVEKLRCCEDNGEMVVVMIMVEPLPQL